MGLFNFLKPVPHKEEIKDQEVVDKNYKYWRFRIFYGMYIGYIFYYFTRKSFTFAMPALMVDLGLDKSELGILGSVLAVTYGFSKFLSGVIADRSNPRYFMGIGLILTGVFNILFGLSSSILFFALFWGLNGCFQGWGWPPCARLLTHWYARKERGTWWGFWNTSHSLGGLSITLLAAFCATQFGWRSALFIPGALSIAVGVFIINRLRDTPQSLGLPPIEKFKNEELPLKTQDKEELSIKEILFTYVLRNKYIWVLAIAYFFVYILRTAISDWSALFLIETKGYSIMLASACVCCFEVGGVCGSLAAGWISDRIFKGRRGPVNVLYSLGIVGAVFALWMNPAASLYLNGFLLFSLGFLVFGPQMLIGMAAAELSHKKASGTATGFVGWVAYLGSATAGYPLGKITQEWGWSGFFVVLAGCGVLCLSLLLPLWKAVSYSHKEEKTAREGTEAEPASS